MIKINSNKKIFLISLITGIIAVSFLICNFCFKSSDKDVAFILDIEQISNRINSDISKSIVEEETDGFDSTILNPQYFHGKFVQETVKMNISDELYNNYRGIGSVEHTVSLKPVKVASYNGVISFRYINDIQSAVDTMDMALDFRLELERSGYQLTINSNRKKVYDGTQYKVVILTEFNYLIIVIIEK